MKNESCQINADMNEKMRRSWNDVFSIVRRVFQGMSGAFLLTSHKLSPTLPAPIVSVEKNVGIDPKGDIVSIDQKYALLEQNSSVSNSHFSIDSYTSTHNYEESPVTLLSGTMRDRNKMWRRDQLLRLHPEKKRRIDTAELKKIIDYVCFKCHPDCSIARDAAVEGSDIDGGILVYRGQVSVELQLHFVNELRRQGFAASHRLEIEELERKVASETNEITWRELVLQLANARLHEILFIPEMKMQQLIANKHVDSNTLIYLAGYSI